MLRMSGFANAVFLAAAGLAAFLFVFSLVTGAPAAYTFATRALLAGALGFFILLLKAPAEYKAKLSLVLVSLGISLLAADIVLAGNPIPEPFLDELAYARSEIPFDTRSKREVVAELRAAGVDAYPVVASCLIRNYWETLNVDGVLPLGGIANTTTVF